MPNCVSIDVKITEKISVEAFRGIKSTFIFYLFYEHFGASSLQKKLFFIDVHKKTTLMGENYSMKGLLLAKG